MVEFLQSTAWPMTKPETFGAFHLTFFFVGITVSVLLAILLRKTNEKQNKILLLSLGAFLAVCEVYKHLFYTYVIGGGNYQWWIFPFQLCSVPMYLLLIVPFLKEGKVKNALYTFLATYNMLGGFISMIEQSGLSHPYVTLTLHAYIWHLMLVFVGLYLVISGRAGKSLKEYVPALIVFGVMCLIAQSINVIFQEHHLAMFDISPFQRTPLIVFKQIEEATNWFVNMIVYCFALSLGAFLFLLAHVNIRKLVTKKTNGKDKSE